MKAIRIFISSPRDVAKERQRAREVVESLRRRYSRHFMLEPVLWEDLPLQSDASFQQGIDAVLSEKGADIAIFILWSRLGSPLGHAVTKPDGTPYRSGTEREYDLITQARAASLAGEGVARPHLLVYTRRDDASFDEALRGTSTREKEELIRQKRSVEQFLSETFKDQTSGHNIGAYFPFDRPTTFSQRLRTHLQNLLDQMAGESTEVIWDTEKQGPPFLGLEAFQPQHAAVFFGREEEILEARRALKEQARDGCAFLLLSGASGSGKSSLARAGVLPAITELEVDEQVAGWRSLVITPSELGSDPITALVARLAATDLLDGPAASAASLADLAAGLKKDPELTFSLRLKDAFVQTSTRQGGAVRLLLLLDQWEELFNTSTISTADRAAFLAVVETFALSGSVWVLATVRSDFYQQIQSEPALVRMKSGHGQLDVLPPGPDSLQRLIEEPARLAGLTFEQRNDQHLSRRIIRDAASHAELLPLVEFVLRELYEQRSTTRQLTFAAYEALGGVEGALAKRADETHAALPGDAQESLAIVLQALVTLDNGAPGGGGEKIVRLRAPLANFDTKPAAKALVEAFITARLFTTCQIEATGESAVTVAHESLLRVWPRAVAWADNNHDFLVTRSRISERMRAGSPLLEGDPLLVSAKIHILRQPESLTPEQLEFVQNAVTAAERRFQRTKQRRRLIVFSLSALTIIATIGGALAWQMKCVADEQTSIAKGQRNEVTRQRDAQEVLLWTASRSDHEAALRASAKRQYADCLAYFDRALKYRPSNSAAMVASAAHAFGPHAATWTTRSLHAVKGNLTCLAFSPNGRCLAIGRRGQTPGESGVQIIEVSTGRIICNWAVGNSVDGLAFSTDGLYLTHIVGSQRFKYPVVIEVSTGLAVGNLVYSNAVGPKHHGETLQTSLSPDGRYIAEQSGEYALRVVEIASGKTILGKRFAVTLSTVSFSLDGRYIAAGCMDGAVEILETATGKEISKFQFRNSVSEAEFSADSDYVVVGSYDNTVRVIETATGRDISRVEFGVAATLVGFSPDGRYIVAASRELHNSMANLRVIEATTGKEVGQFMFGAGVTSIGFSPDGRYLAAGGLDKTARVFEMPTLRETRNLVCGGEVTSVVFSPDGYYLAVGSADKMVRVMETTMGKGITPEELDSKEEPSAPWISALYVQSGVRFQADGKMAVLTAAEMLSAQEDVLTFIKTQPKPHEVWQHAILKWSQHPPEQRSTSPWTKEMAFVSIGRSLMNSGRARPAWTEASWHPLAPISWARIEPNPFNRPPSRPVIFGIFQSYNTQSPDVRVAQPPPVSGDGNNESAYQAMMIRPRFLARLTLRRLREADENLYGRETLANYAAWSAKIMHDELHLDSEAQDAINFALEHTPKDKQQPLLDLKAMWKLKN